MDISIVLIGLGLLIFCSHIFSAMFSKTKLPNVLLLMIIGLLLGPVFGLVQPSDMGKFGSVFTTMTLIAILFQSGTSLDLKALGNAVAPALVLTILNFVFALGLGILCGKVLLGFDWIPSLFLGAAMGGTSSAVVIPMVNQLKPSEAAGTVLSLESALSDIVCLIIAMALLAGFESGTVSVNEIALNITKSMLLAIIFGVGVGFVWIFILKKFLSEVQNSMFTTFALAFMIYGISERLGINGGMTVLTFGLAVANFYRATSIVEKTFAGGAAEVELNRNERNFFSEIVFVLQTYFFVYIGISISFGNLWHILIGLLFAVLIFVCRVPVVALLGKKKYTKRDRTLMRLLGPKGLVAAVLASLPLQWAAGKGLSAGNATYDACAAIQNMAYAVVFFTIILCSVMVMVAEKKLAAKAEIEEPAAEDAQAEESATVEKPSEETPAEEEAPAEKPAAAEIVENNNENKINQQ